jgi:hypothetical protein
MPASKLPATMSSSALSQCISSVMSRKGVEEVGQMGHHQDVGGSARQIEPKHAGRLVTGFIEAVDGERQRCQSRLSLGQKALAEFCHADAPRRTVKQAHAETALELAKCL